MDLFRLHSCFDTFQAPPPTQPARKHHKKRVTHALRMSQHHSLANKIEFCRKGERCSNVYCPECRHSMAKRLAGRMLDHVVPKYQNAPPSVRKDQLRHLTVLVDLRYPVAADIKRCIRQTRAKVKAALRAFPRVWMQGAFELELVDVPRVLAGGSTGRKADTIKSLLKYDGQLSPRLFGQMVLVHFHAMIDVNFCDAVGIRRSLTKQFPGPYMVRLQRTHFNQELKELAWKLGSYPFKDRVQYNHSFQTSAFLLGDYLSDVSLCSLVKLYSECSDNGYKCLLIAAKGRSHRVSFTGDLLNTIESGECDA